jgi:hypothetical protein
MARRLPARVSLLAAGERGVAGQLASLLGTTPFWELAKMAREDER